MSPMRKEKSFESSPKRSPVQHKSPRFSPLNKANSPLNKANRPKPTGSPRFSSLLEDRGTSSGRRNSGSSKL